MAVSDQDPYLLPCGRDADTLWAHVVASSHDEHEQTCPHCQAAAAGLHALRRAAGELAQRDDTPPPGLTARIMRAVRADTRDNHHLVLDATETGLTRITAQAAAVVLRFAANHVPNAVARSCHVETDPQAGPGRYRVRIALALRYGANAAPTLARVRRLVDMAARELVGFETTRIDIDMVDITEPDQRPPSR